MAPDGPCYPWRCGCERAAARVDVADLQAQSFAEAKSEAVKGEEHDAVAVP